MRSLAATLLTLTFTLVVPAAGADVSLSDGRWKLTVLPFGNDEYLIFNVRTVRGRPYSMVASSQPVLGVLETAEIVSKGEDLTITFPAPEPHVFRGTFRGGKALGTFHFKGVQFPARVEKTEAEKVAALRPSPFRNQVSRALEEKDPKWKVMRLNQLIRKYRGQPMNAAAYAPMLAAAVDAGLGPGAVRGYVNAWTAEAEPYGPEWAGEVRSKALKVLAGKKAYAGLATELAEAAVNLLPADAPLESRVDLTAELARSARLAGNDTLAATAESRVREMETRLDAEYRAVVPPFKTTTYSGRKRGKGGRAVVMEIFTGSQCPPCVAVDVGFDALLMTYQPTEFIGLQYHLHVPGPDPLTNPDSVARQAYYGEQADSTPAVFVDGRAVGNENQGGPMDRAEARYKELRSLIEPEMETESRTEITLTADRVGDEIKIVARAGATGAVAKNARPRLRIVLVEASIRYTGVNKLRFHHNVVRAFPGGVDGKALAGGKGEITTSVTLSDLRKNLATYLDEYPSTDRPFPNALPPIDLDDLAVVAFVQDDADHSIWQGAQVPVGPVKP